MIYKANIFMSKSVYTICVRPPPMQQCSALGIRPLQSRKLLSNQLLKVFKSERLSNLEEFDLEIIESKIEQYLTSTPKNSLDLSALSASNLDLLSVIDRLELGRHFWEAVESISNQGILTGGYFHGDLWYANILKNQDEYLLIDYDRSREYYLPQLDVMHLLVFNEFFSKEKIGWSEVIKMAIGPKIGSKYSNILQIGDRDLKLFQKLYLITIFAQNEIKFSNSAKYLRWRSFRSLFNHAIYNI
jgi:hypothetical protein